MAAAFNEDEGEDEDGDYRREDRGGKPTSARPKPITKGKHGFSEPRDSGSDTENLILGMDSIKTIRTVSRSGCGWAQLEQFLFVRNGVRLALEWFLFLFFRL